MLITAAIPPTQLPPYTSQILAQFIISIIPRPSPSKPPELSLPNIFPCTKQFKIDVDSHVPNSPPAHKQPPDM